MKSRITRLNLASIGSITISDGEDDLTTGISAPPFAVRDREHLVELLLEGMNSGPGIEATLAFWSDLRSDLKKRCTLRRLSSASESTR